MCTSTRVLISVMSIWPEAAHDEKGVEILSDDLGDSEEEDVETTCIRGP